jgi:calcium-dependent protein kinase
MLDAKGEIKLVDFGLSLQTNQNIIKSNSLIGTPYYMAPECQEGFYSTKSDLWSVGVILYTLVSGYLPFQGKSQTELFNRINNLKFHFSHEEFKSVSKECKDLISQLLVKETSTRLSAAKAL